MYYACAYFLSVGITRSCDVHLVGFDYQEPKFDEIPQQIRKYRKGKGHPNREDIRKGCRFTANELRINRK